MDAAKSLEILGGMIPSTYSFVLQELMETHGGRSLPPVLLDVPSKFEHVIPQTF